MATHNGAPWIKEQVESIMSQEGVQVTLNVFDDCSTDDTECQIRGLSRTYSDIALHRYEHPSGSAGTAFLGAFTRIDARGFDYLALADQDDVWLNNKLMRAAEKLAGKPKAAGYSCSSAAFWSDGTIKLLRQNSHVRPLDYLFEGAGQGCTFVMRAHFFSEIQPLFKTHQRLFRAFHYHDWLLYLLTRARGRDWIFDDHPGILYRQHNKNELGARGTRLALTKRLNLIKSGWYRHQITTAIQIATHVMPSTDNARLVSFMKIYRREQSISRQLRVAHMILLHGRRRFRERLFVALCSLVGWI